MPNRLPEIAARIAQLRSKPISTNASSLYQRIMANIAVGIVGSWLGSWLAPKLGLVPNDGIGRFLVGVGGAVLLIWILKTLKVLR